MKPGDLVVPHDGMHVYEDITGNHRILTGYVRCGQVCIVLDSGYSMGDRHYYRIFNGEVIGWCREDRITPVQSGPDGE